MTGFQRPTFLDDANPDRSRIRTKPGLRKEVVEFISQQKNEPEWLLQKRLQAFALYEQTPLPKWGPSLSQLNLDDIVYYAEPNTGESRAWEDVPDEIRSTFDKLGIPEAERTALAGVGAQYDSSVVYHNIQEDLRKQGVVFENMDIAVRDYPELVKKYFMTQCVPIHDHKFAMLHAAVWSGGTFIYVPKGVKVTLPLQAYFRMNMEGGGQFEHTLIIADDGADVSYIEGCSAPRYTTNALHAGCVEIFVHKNARVRYYSIENWSKNTYNLNTKRAIVDEHGIIEWINGNMGSGVTMLYPASILRGDYSRSDYLGVAFAGPGQHQDTGGKAIHVGNHTKSLIHAKSISVGGGTSSYRGLVKVMPKAKQSHVSVTCDALLIDDQSSSTTYPVMDIRNNRTTVAHEASVGKIGDDALFYLQSRGLSATQAMQLVVAGFVEPVIKRLPLEYALELNRLIEHEMEGAVG